MIEILDGALSPERCLQAVRSPEAGGVAMFIGSVRDVSGGVKVDHLEYEAYEPMALAAMQEIVDEACRRWPVRAFAIQHRVGELSVGDDAVIIAVSCPHRAEAFEACRFTIDRLKQTVPIWKKEHGENGETWVEGPPLVSPPSSLDPVQD